MEYRTFFLKLQGSLNVGSSANTLHCAESVHGDGLANATTVASWVLAAATAFSKAVCSVAVLPLTPLPPQLTTDRQATKSKV